MIRGIGIDICDMNKLKRAIKERRGFLKRVFSPAEILYCSGKKRPILHYAGRFAAKEAFIKAVSIDRGIRLNMIDTRNDAHGRPGITVNTSVRALLRKKRAKKIMISITHTKTAAAAVCVLE